MKDTNNKKTKCMCKRGLRSVRSISTRSIIHKKFFNYDFQKKCECEKE
jgi:hypothetical protein